MGSPEGELSLVLTDDEHIAALNQQYLHRSGPTNVISFPMDSPPRDPKTPCMLGDVVISVDTAQREAAEGGVTFETRFDELLIHGILHLFGFDHETTASEARRMEEKSQELLQRLKDERG